MRLCSETPPTRFDAFTRFINGPQLVAVIFEIVRPPPETGRNFQNRADRQKLANTRENCSVPLRSGTAPRRRPFLARLFPIVFHSLEPIRNSRSLRGECSNALSTHLARWSLTGYANWLWRVQQIARSKPAHLNDAGGPCQPLQRSEERGSWIQRLPCRQLYVRAALSAASTASHKLPRLLSGAVDEGIP